MSKDKEESAWQSTWSKALAVPVDESGPPSRRGSKPRRRVPSRFDDDILESYYQRRDNHPNRRLFWKSYDVPKDQVVTTRTGNEISIVTAIDREIRKAAKSLIPDDNAELAIVFKTNLSPVDQNMIRIWFATKLKGEKIS